MLSKKEINILKSISKKKYRYKYNIFKVEGIKSIIDLIKNDITKIKKIYTIDLSLFSKNIIKNIEIILINERELKKISELKSPNKAIAVCYINKKSSIKIKKEKLTVALDNIKDPGNMGTIIRLCAWFGIENIICNINCVDLYNHKTIISSMGTFDIVNISYVNLEMFIKEYKGYVIGSFNNEGASIYNTRIPNKGILVMGNESKGISNNIKSLITHKITIPSFNKNYKVDSLNVAISTSIILTKMIIK